MAHIAKIAVYFFLLQDGAGGWIKQPQRATRAHIEAAGGAFLFNTKLEVDQAEVTPAGLHAPSQRVAPR